MPEKIAIERWSRAGGERLLPALDVLFFETSTTKSFTSPEARAAFRERWLGRYLVHDPHLLYLALRPDGGLAGYLAGCLDDPAVTPRFSDLPYFQDFAPHTRVFPAHLHVNVAPACQGQGIGSRLLATFAEDAARAGTPGVHAVTAKGAANTLFYRRQGFRELGETRWNGRDIVLLGRRLRT